MGAIAHLSNIQKEMLKLYSANIKENELLDIKEIIGQYFAQKASKAADKVWEEKNYSDADMDKWLNEK